MEGLGCGGDYAQFFMERVFKHWEVFKKQLEWHSVFYKVEFDHRLALMILEGFSNLNNSVILCWWHLMPRGAHEGNVGLSCGISLDNYFLHPLLPRRFGVNTGLAFSPELLSSKERGEAWGSFPVCVCVGMGLLICQRQRVTLQKM